MATIPTDPRLEAATPFVGVGTPAWTRIESVVVDVKSEGFSPSPSSHDALQALLAFSGACFRTAQVITCDDTETDARVNLNACRRLGARSMVAVPLCGRRRVIGLLEAFSANPFGFNDNDIQNLTLLAELVLGALKPEDEDRFAESAKVAEAKLGTPAPAMATVAEPEAARPARVVTAAEGRHGVVKLETPDAAVAVAILNEPVEIAKPVTIDKVEITETLIATEFASEQVERPSRRPLVFALLALVVIVCAVAGGIWWKTQTAQLGSAMVQTGNSASTQSEATAGTAAT